MVSHKETLGGFPPENSPGIAGFEAIWEGKGLLGVALNDGIVPGDRCLGRLPSPEEDCHGNV